MTSKSIEDTVVHVTKVIAGTKKRFPNGAQVLSFGGGHAHGRRRDERTCKRSSPTGTAVDTARAATQVALDANQAAAPSLLALLSEYTKFLRVHVRHQCRRARRIRPDASQGAGAEDGSRGGLAAKAKATRQARGTTSAKQKKSVKGNVTATLVVTPVTSAPAPAPVTEAPPAAASPAAATAPKVS